MSTITPTVYPTNWAPEGVFNPNDHMMQLKGKDYLNVQARLQWFIRDQRAMIVAGLAKTPYVIKTDLVEARDGFAHFKTFIRDVLGNEVTMYGSETAKDFTDYAEKASTKSLGRALLLLGYGTANASEFDEGEKPVDAPNNARTPAQNGNGHNPPTPTNQTASQNGAAKPANTKAAPLTDADLAKAIDAKAATLGLSRENVKQYMRVNQISTTRAGFEKVHLALQTPETACKAWAAAHLLAESTITHLIQQQGLTWDTLYQKLLDAGSRTTILDLIASPPAQITMSDESYIAEDAL